MVAQLTSAHRQAIERGIDVPAVIVPWTPEPQADDRVRLADVIGIEGQAEKDPPVAGRTGGTAADDPENMPIF